MTFSSKDRLFAAGCVASVAAAAGLAWRLAHGRRRRADDDATLVAPLISSRGARLNLPSLPYIDGVIEGFREPYDAAARPDGVIMLAVAENKVSPRRRRRQSR
jgi:hypothetical protein